MAKIFNQILLYEKPLFSWYKVSTPDLINATDPFKPFSNIAIQPDGSYSFIIFCMMRCPLLSSK